MATYMNAPTMNAKNSKRFNIYPVLGRFILFRINLFENDAGSAHLLLSWAKRLKYCINVVESREKIWQPFMALF